MKKIGFKNFRRFKELEPLELGEITLMVGKNNSGKSTLIKAILLVLDYLKNQQSDTFSFDNETLNDANIVTFERAKCKLQDEPSIEFYFEIENYQIEISISGEEKWTFADVNKVAIKDTNISLELMIDYQTKTIHISRQAHETHDDIDKELAKNELREKIVQLRNELKSFNKTSREYLNIVNSINVKDKRLRELEVLEFEEVSEVNDPDAEYDLNEPENQISKERSTTHEYSLEYPLNDFSTVTTERSVLEEIVSDLLANNHNLRVFYISRKENKENFTNEDNEAFDQTNRIDGDKNIILNSISALVKLLYTKKVFYLGANPTKQSALFKLRDKENALGQAIHQFYQLKIQKGQAEYVFIEKWMKVFGIGTSFEINFISGEAYECSVIDDGVKTHLADMGMGSLQLMQLLFKVATMLRLYKAETKGVNLIVEEPELSLHPNLQSKLADFFFEVNKEFGVKFIVETHSEYIIRRTQVIGLKEKLVIDQASNPFKIYYFHMDEGPYEMKYTSEGKFDRSFAKGFTNVATDSTKEMLKLNRR